MTTIAYSAGWLAVDSYAVCNAGGGTHKVKASKARRTPCGRAYIATAGGILTEEQFNDLAEKLLVEIVRMETTPRDELFNSKDLLIDQTCIIMTCDAAYYYRSDERPRLGKLLPNDYIAFGTGVNFATVALAAGQPLWKAMAVAEYLDPYTTAPIHLYQASKLQKLIQEVPDV